MIDLAEKKGGRKNDFFPPTDDELFRKFSEEAKKNKVIVLNLDIPLGTVSAIHQIRSKPDLALMGCRVGDKEYYLRLYPEVLAFLREHAVNQKTLAALLYRLEEIEE